MPIRFVWEGNEYDKTGKATFYLSYTIEKEFVINLPSLERAREFEEMLEFVWKEALKEGLAKMQHTVYNAISQEIYAHSH